MNRDSNLRLARSAIILLLPLMLPIIAWGGPIPSSCLEDMRSFQITNEDEACVSRPRTAWIIESEPDQSDDIIPEIAVEHLAQGNIQVAIADWRQIVSEHPADALAQYQLGLLLTSQYPEAALAHLESAASLDEQYTEPVMMLRQAIMSARIADDPAYTLLSAGRALASIDQWRLAAEAFRNAVLQNPAYAEAWAYLGEAHQHLIKSDENNLTPDSSDGLLELQTALQLDPDSVAANTFLSLYWLRRHEYKLAQEAIQRSIALAPDNPVLVSQLAAIQASLGEIQDAYQTYQQAASLAPYDPTYQRQIVLFSLEYNYQVEQIALPIARQLLITDLENPIDLDLMGQALIHQGDLLNGERFLARALKINPNFGPAYLHLGLIYLLKDQPQTARIYLEKARELAAGTASALQAENLLEGLPPP